MRPKLYHLYIKGNDKNTGLTVIMMNEEHSYTDAEFKSLVVGIMQKLTDSNGHVGAGDMLDTLFEYGFVEPERVDLNWAEALESVKS
jgi:hypothetical protein